MKAIRTPSIILWKRDNNPLTLAQKQQRIGIEMHRAIQKMISKGEREWFIKGTPGIGKTTFYCDIAKNADKAVTILLPWNGIYDQIGTWIWPSKKTVIINTTNADKLSSIINTIDNNTIIVTNFRTFTLIHNLYPILFGLWMSRIGYVFSDELHRGIGKQTMKAMHTIRDYAQEEIVDPWYEDVPDADEQEADTSLDNALSNNTGLLHIGFTGTPTYSHKSVYNHFECIYNYTTQRGLEEGIITPLKHIDIGEWVQYVETEHWLEKDLESGYKEYYIEKDGKLLPVADVILNKVLELKTQEPMHAMGVCANINQIKDIQAQCIQQGLRPYCVHSGNKHYKKEWSLQEAKEKIEAGEIDIILVCNTGVEALDIPKLNTLCYFYATHSPVKLNQSIWRVTRMYPDKKYANILVPKTKIIYAPQEERKIGGGKSKVNPSQTVGRLDWKDVYYTLADFTEAYLLKHGICSKDYDKFLKLQNQKREEIEQMKKSLFSQLDIRLAYLGLPKSPMIYKFLDDIGIIFEPNTALNKCLDIVSYSKKSYLSEKSTRTWIGYNDFVEYMKQYAHDLSYQDFDFAKHPLFNQSDVYDLLDQKKSLTRKYQSISLSNSIEKHDMQLFNDTTHIAVRNKLIASTLPLTMVLCNIFARYIDRKTISPLTLDDIIQECITANIILTDVYDTQTHTRYYEVICWNTIKTITDTILKYNTIVPIDNEKQFGVANEFTRLVAVLNEMYSEDGLMYPYHFNDKGVIEFFDDELKKQLIDILYTTSLENRTPLDPIVTEWYHNELNDVLTKQDFRTTWDRVSKTLTDRPTEVLDLFFWLSNGNNGMELEDIGERLDVSRERTRQIKDKAITHLRSDSRKKLFWDFLNSDFS